MNSKLVLFLDDDASQLEFYALYLKEAKINYLLANNSREAIEFAKRYHPALMVIDYQLPGLNGLEFCEVIREIESLKDCILLIFTAKELNPQEEEAFHDIPDSWISKQNGPENLIKAIKAWLNIV